MNLDETEIGKLTFKDYNLSCKLDNAKVSSLLKCWVIEVLAIKFLKEISRLEQILNFFMSKGFQNKNQF